jgi:archaellum biogenesis protein FlaJ (TadC family)
MARASLALAGYLSEPTQQKVHENGQPFMVFIRADLGKPEPDCLSR